jgi:prepilin-type N-terminal cleavage/methylation domain-containing protein
MSNLFRKRAMMRTPARNTRKREGGFTLIEVLIAMGLVGIALLGLAELFVLSVKNNLRSDRITNASFLAQERIDFLRSLTSGELTAMMGSPTDELINTNGDAFNDFRRITVILSTGTNWEVRVLVYSAERLTEPINQLITNPARYGARADTSTLISR